MEYSRGADTAPLEVLFTLLSQELLPFLVQNSCKRTLTQVNSSLIEQVITEEGRRALKGAQA